MTPWWSKITLSQRSLREFYFNSSYAKAQILQLFITDPAFYKNWDDIQKRLAQLRAPGLSYDIFARNKYNDNKLFSEDGLQKSVMIRDFEGTAKEIKDIKQVFDNESNRLIAELNNKYRVLPGDSKEIAKTKPKCAIEYVSKHGKEEDLEPTIAKDEMYSTLYAERVLKGPFKLGEPAIAKDAEWSYLYANYALGKQPFPLGEPAIATDTDFSFEYTHKVLKKDFYLDGKLIYKYY